MAEPDSLFDIDIIRFDHARSNNYVLPSYISSEIPVDIIGTAFFQRLTLFPNLVSQPLKTLAFASALGMRSPLSKQTYVTS